MTIRYFVLTVIVTFLLALSQVLVKLGLNNIGGLKINFKTFFSDIIPIISSHYILLGFLTIIVSSLLWMKVLSKVNLSIAYPMISLSYIFGFLGAVFILDETMPFVRWIGLIVIIVGIFLITR